MADTIIRKPDKDFTKEADKLIPEAQELAKVDVISRSSNQPVLTCCAQDNVQTALDKLLGLEKQTRQVSPPSLQKHELVLTISTIGVRSRIDLEVTGRHRHSM